MRQDELLCAPSFSIEPENETLADLDFSQLTTFFPDQRTLRDSPGDSTTNMDFYGADRKLSEIGDGEFTDFLDSDIFTPPASECNVMEHIGMDTMDDEWLDNFFDDPVLNDKMMTEAIQPARVQSEHSYSLTNDETGSNTPIVVKVEPDKDLEPEMLINPNMTMITTDQVHDKITVKEEPSAPTSKSNSTMTLSHRYHNQTLLKQPTIILATQQQTTSSQSHIYTSSSIPAVIPKVNIKVEAADSLSYYTTSTTIPSSPDTTSDASSPEHCGYDYIGLPPTPPSSSNSDSECGSPHRSAPGSPLAHQTPLARQQQQHHVRPLQQPLFTSPIPTSGMLILSEEEKRTLITEGYPIPNKLPLTKQEEKNLKKIRRKIKNKISAQESRRKKKEYMETLEKRMEAYSQENTDLKKKCDVLENNNRSLLGQLHKLQALVSKVPMSASSTQTGTCLMVLVLFFAVFLGTWSPLTMSIGYGRNLLPSPSNSNAATVSKVVSAALDSPIGPPVQEPSVDPYTTPSMKSRVLMSVRDEVEEAEYGPASSHYHDLFFSFLSSLTCSDPSADLSPQPSSPQPHVTAFINEGEVEDPSGAVSMDLSMDYVERVMTVSAQVNTTQ